MSIHTYKEAAAAYAKADPDSDAIITAAITLKRAEKALDDLIRDAMEARDNLVLARDIPGTDEGKAALSKALATVNNLGGSGTLGASSEKAVMNLVIASATMHAIYQD